jgi:hypothetical protein
VSHASSCGKTIDDVDEFEEMFGAQAKEERVAKFQPKVQTKLLLINVLIFHMIIGSKNISLSNCY